MKDTAQGLGLGLGQVWGEGLRRAEGVGQGLVQGLVQGLGQMMVLFAIMMARLDECVCSTYLALEATMCSFYLLALQAVKGCIVILNDALTTAMTTAATTTASSPVLHPPRHDPLTRSARLRALALVGVAAVVALLTKGFSSHGLRSEREYASPLVDPSSSVIFFLPHKYIYLKYILLKYI